MGRLSHDPYIQHFSHPHQLELTNSQALNTTLPCSGCKLQPSGWMYNCRPCNFTLHLSCIQMPQLINHPSHSFHPLTLLPIPIYPGGLFNCDGCGHQGSGFSYHCTQCDFDLHILCASKPLSLTHQSHPCPLMLTFDPPYQTKGFSCDICRRLGSNHWLYRCSRCEFDAHLDCAANIISTPRPMALQQPQTQTQSQVHHILHHNSFPGGNHQVQYGNSRPAGNGMMNMNQNQNQNQQYVHSQSMGAMPIQNYQYQQATAAPCAQPGNALVNAAIQGFVEGAAQQVGQNFLQSIMNDGDNGDAVANGGIGVGSLVLDGIYCDSGSGETQN